MIHSFSSHIILSLQSKERFIDKNQECYYISSCMAANLHSLKLATVGKKFVTHLTSHSSASLLLRRSVHVSVYDKNWEDHVHSALVPDEVIQLQSEKYWSPHPQTGVFGPATDHHTTSGGERGFHSVTESTESVLEQKTFFRPLENLDKPAHP